MTELAVCAIVKDEGAYLHEWICFHRLIGVERFYLYDNDSSDDTLEVLLPHMLNGYVELTRWPGRVRQLDAYHHCLLVHRDSTRWIAFIDADEFLWSPRERWLPKLLADYRHVPALQARWVVFGTSGHDTPPEGALVTEAYTWREAALDNPHVKTIAQPTRTGHALDPHHFTHDEIPVRFHPDELRVNHYWTKSKLEASLKFARGRADIAGRREWGEFEAQERALNAVEDTLLRDLYGDDLRAAMAGSPR